MKRLSPEKLQHNNRLGTLLLLIAYVVTLLIISLPVYEFDTTLFTKKSGNTFKDDERYTAAMTEVNAAMDALKAEGITNMTLIETPTERMNSKGETTSMFTFTITASVKKTGWDFMASGLPSGTLLLIAFLAMTLALVCMGLTLPGAQNIDPVDMKGGKHALRIASCWLALIALVLLPVFHFATVRCLERDVIAHLRDGVAPALLRQVDSFLYGGADSANLTELLSGLTYHSIWTLWLGLPSLFMMMLGTVLLAKGSLSKTLQRGALYLFVIVLCVVTLYPYYVMVVTAFQSSAETTDMYFTHMLPKQWMWSNMVDILYRGIPQNMLNSLLLSFGATAIALLCGIPAAYAMARMSFKGKKAFLGFVIMSQMFAPVVLLVGISQLMNFLHLNDTLLGLVLINAAFNQAFSIWLLRGTFMAISPEMEQAACIDGCNTVSSLIRVLLPMAAPGIVTTLIFVFINAWNEYTISTVLISTSAKRPITVGITQFSSYTMIEWHYMFAAALLATIPVVILFMCIEKHIATGLTSGGVKG